MKQAIIGCILLVTVAIATDPVYPACGDPNEYRHGCGRCQATCANPDLQPCEEGIYCFVPECICLPGFVRVSETDRRCIPVGDCGKVLHGCHGKCGGQASALGGSPGCDDPCGCDKPCSCKK